MRTAATARPAGNRKIGVGIPEVAVIIEVPVHPFAGRRLGNAGLMLQPAAHAVGQESQEIGPHRMVHQHESDAQEQDAGNGGGNERNRQARGGRSVDALDGTVMAELPGEDDLQEHEPKHHQQQDAGDLRADTQAGNVGLFVAGGRFGWLDDGLAWIVDDLAVRILFLELVPIDPAQVAFGIVLIGAPGREVDRERTFARIVRYGQQVDAAQLGVAGTKQADVALGLGAAPCVLF